MSDFLSNNIINGDMQTIFRQVKCVHKLKNCSVLVSGASGMLASYCVMFFIYLNEIHGYNIKILANARNVKKLENRYGFYLKKPYFEIIEGAVEDINLNYNTDYILHTASPASPQFYGGMPVETILPNVVGTNNLLKIAVKNKIRSFLFFSSGAVYGKTSVDKITEGNCGYLNFLEPGAVYGESKRCGEALCLAYYREYGIPVKIIRINHTYGPTLDLKNDKRSFSEFVKNILEGKDIVLRSDGSELRSFCYLTDAISTLLTVLLEGKDGECYNLSNEKQFVSIKDLAEILVSLYPESGTKVVYGERNDSGYLSLAQTNRAVCSSFKTEALGCEYKVGIKEGFRRTIDYFKNFNDKSLEI